MDYVMELNGRPVTPGELGTLALYNYGLKGVITRLGFVTWSDAVPGVGHPRCPWRFVLSI
jgi:hypothetical protein